MTEEEKQRLLRNQEDNLESIKSILDKDKQAQEQEFDKILKERLDRRRRLREKEKAKELAEQTKEQTDQVESEFAQREKDLIQESKQTLDRRIKQAMDENTFENQREAVKAIEEDEEAKRKAAINDLKADKEAEIKRRKDEVYKKLIMSQEDEAEMREQLMKIKKGDESTIEEMLRKADQEKSNQNSALADKLAARKKAQADRRAAQKAEFDAENEEMDIV